MPKRPYPVHREILRDMTGVLTRAMLDEAFLLTCVDPQDEGRTRALGIRPQCHPAGGVEVFYRAGALALLCHDCHAPFMVIRLEEEEAPPHR